ncbi:MAG: LysR family transcriptional regulator [Rhizobiales bacterium]|nr:LysR family transcriptional regulator [Hyphomicrobiales bacterium]
MAVTLNRLRTFVVLAKTGSFQRTSDIVGRSQPAVSEQIRSLEESLGVPLFHRKTRSVSLTQVGELLFSRVERILAELDDLLNDVQDIATLESGQVRIGVTPTLAGYMLPQILQSYQDKFPGVRVHFVDEPTLTLERMVIDRELDFYFGPKPTLNSGLSFSVVAKDEYVVVVPKNHPLSKKKKVSIDALKKENFLLMKPGTMVRREVDEFFAGRSIRIEPIEEVSNHFTLGGLVAAGRGITMLPYLALLLIGHPGIAIVRISDATLYRDLGIATRGDYRPAPAVTAFMNMMVPFVKRQCGKHNRQSGEFPKNLDTNL